MTDDVEAFFAKHAAGGPSHVVAAIAVRANGEERFAVFSTIENARAWSDSLPEPEYGGVAFVPYIIDVPEFGNVPKGERQ